MDGEYSLDRRVEAAWRFYGQGNYARAREFGLEILTRDPHHPRVHLMLGYCSLATDQGDEAEHHARTLLESHPNWAQGHLLWGHVMHRFRKEPIAAEKHFREAIRLDPENSDHHATLGLFLGGRGRLQEGITVARTGFKIDPQSPAPVEALQVLYRLDDDDEMAEEFGQLALASNPEESEQHLEAGLRLLEGSDRQQARSSFVEALRLDPTDIDARDRIAHEQVRTLRMFRDAWLVSFKPSWFIPLLMVPLVWYGLSLLFGPFIWMCWISIAAIVGWVAYSGLFYLLRWWYRRRIDASKL